MTFFMALSRNNNLLDLSSSEITPWDEEIRVEQHDGDIPDVSRYYWNPSTLAFEAKGGVRVTRLEFLRRLTVGERVLARNLSATDPVVADFFQLIDLAEEIIIGDPDLTMAMHYLASQGVIAPERIPEIVAES